jgi:cell division protein FtsL
MLDDRDIQKLIEVFATREELKEMISCLVTKEEFSNLQTAIDAYAKRCDDYFKEMVALAHKVDRLEKWIHQIAKKIGMQLEY